ncbi:MAG: hypothetical protein JXR70_07495 [Spirochaetales bacterium]|nr:hypothetical protein [Spirochaetales bacterium]
MNQLNKLIKPLIPENDDVLFYIGGPYTKEKYLFITKLGYTLSVSLSTPEKPKIINSIETKNLATTRLTPQWELILQFKGSGSEKITIKSQEDSIGFLEQTRNLLQHLWKTNPSSAALDLPKNEKIEEVLLSNTVIFYFTNKSLVVQNIDKEGFGETERIIFNDIHEIDFFSRKSPLFAFYVQNSRSERRGWLMENPFLLFSPTIGNTQNQLFAKRLYQECVQKHPSFRPHYIRSDEVLEILSPAINAEYPNDEIYLKITNKRLLAIKLDKQSNAFVQGEWELGNIKNLTLESEKKSKAIIFQIESDEKISFSIPIEFSQAVKELQELLQKH